MDLRLVHLCILTLSCSFAQDIDLGTVIFANVLFRHGDRTPLNPYPTDPYKNESLWPVPFGQLTNLGRHRHLLLGRWLRNRYEHLLPDTYSLYDIYVRSTDVDRTLMSAEANLAGLYPPKDKQIWDNDIKWMPIPIHTIPEKQDNLLAAKKYCPKYDYEIEKLKNSPEIQRINKENEKLYIYLTEHSGKKIDSLESIEYLYDTLSIENIFNLTLPKWTTPVFPYKMQKLASMDFKLPAYNKILQRLKSGLLLGEMINHMVKKQEGALYPDRKLWIYSAHDTTVANLLMTLGVFDEHCPPYTATVLMELRVNTKEQYFVTISYKNSSAEPTLLTIPGCLALCPLHQFVKLTKDTIPEDWEKECVLDWEQHESSINLTTIFGILTSSILMLISLVFMIIGFVYWHYKREHNQYYRRLTTDPI
ncbi:prostatic acid phosphatase [Cephus cinctus]|uniref:acid phosphatase n=1 Tax=Cephus cinctus TaxID=211228 RepID=A0AAJ7CHJ3_CEPCN|nr:prostatic acid phosphatase [Cephus cinctus]